MWKPCPLFWLIEEHVHVYHIGTIHWPLPIMCTHLLSLLLFYHDCTNCMSFIARQKLLKLMFFADCNRHQMIFILSYLIVFETMEIIARDRSDCAVIGLILNAYINYETCKINLITCCVLQVKRKLIYICYLTWCTHHADIKHGQTLIHRPQNITLAS